MKNLIVLFFIITIISCNNKTNSSSIDGVISFMIDKKALPLPPAHINDSATVIDKKTIDSLLKIKLKVALYPTTDIFSEKELKKIPEEYFDKFSMNDNTFKKITLNGISSKKGHKVVLADATELKKSKDFKNFDLLFWFSDFYFSKDNQKVLFNLGVSRSRLAGSSSLYILKKENSQWKIEYSRSISEW
ncbi:hypothetical protein VOI54_03240 [Tamlana sp. 2201CG12-4]|uniref:hypothetical protein n=1 Tax=Tamlana sp. 2201CG12-4 TaxID=3112582 RepID=UPI002DBAC74C|nr:hypothetical protein [Tamlana sp. 2201CG12-4]MEC3906015.1 hypothetical protein [Tamlana sp. 2201CG12-4]